MRPNHRSHHPPTEVPFGDYVLLDERIPGGHHSGFNRLTSPHAADVFGADQKETKTLRCAALGVFSFVCPRIFNGVAARLFCC